MVKHASLLQKVYAAFNARDIDSVFEYVQQDVHWPNGWEGGYLEGVDALRVYWKRQWAVLDPHVQPISFGKRTDGQIAVSVHQVIKDRQGNLISDSMVNHVYSFTHGLIQGMEINPE